MSNYLISNKYRTLSFADSYLCYGQLSLVVPLYTPRTQVTGGRWGGGASVPVLPPGLPWDTLEGRGRPDGVDPATGPGSSPSSPLVMDPPLAGPGDPPWDPPAESRLLLWEGETLKERNGGRIIFERM